MHKMFFFSWQLIVFSFSSKFSDFAISRRISAIRCANFTIVPSFFCVSFYYIFVCRQTFRYYYKSDNPLFAIAFPSSFALYFSSSIYRFWYSYQEFHSLLYRRLRKRIVIYMYTYIYIYTIENLIFSLNILIKNKN